MKFNSLVLESRALFTDFDTGLRYIILNESLNDKGYGTLIKLYENDDIYLEIYSSVTDYGNVKVSSFESAMKVSNDWLN